MTRHGMRSSGSVRSFSASNKKASNAETAENDSRVFDKGNGLFCFSRRALRPLRFILLQALNFHHRNPARQPYEHAGLSRGKSSDQAGSIGWHSRAGAAHRAAEGERLVEA